jgi:hypothetical protein
MGGDACAAKRRPEITAKAGPNSALAEGSTIMVLSYLVDEFPVFFPVISEILTARKFQVAEASGRVFLL